MFSMLFSAFFPAFLLAAIPSFAIDGQLADWFRHRLGPALAWVFGAMSTPGCALWVGFAVVVMLLVLWHRKSWHSFFTVLLAIPCGALLGETLKLIIRRPRPFVGGPFGEWGGYSFPSGHTISATLLYGCIAFMLIPLVKGRRRRALLVLSSATLIAGVALSRVALGAHYLSDVVGAIVIGFAWLGVCFYTVSTVRRLRSRVVVPLHDDGDPE